VPTIVIAGMSQGNQEFEKNTEVEEKKGSGTAVFTGIQNRASHGRVIVFYCNGPQQDQTAKEKAVLCSIVDLPSMKYPPFCQGACGCNRVVHLYILCKSLCLYDDLSQIQSFTLRIIPSLCRKRWHNETQ